MEFVISIARPGKLWNLSEGHGKSWKSNMFAKTMSSKLKKEQMSRKQALNSEEIYTSTHFMHYNAGEYVK